MDIGYEEIAAKLKMNRYIVEKQAKEIFLRQMLRKIKCEIALLTMKYGVKSSEEMEQKYREGTLVEEGTWEDFFRLDYLEAEQAEIENMLERLA